MLYDVKLYRVGIYLLFLSRCPFRYNGTIFAAKWSSNGFKIIEI